MFSLPRLFTIVLVSPILMRASYEYNWRWGVVIAWSGIKGVFNLLLAPDIYNLAEHKAESPELVRKPCLTIMHIYSFCSTCHCTQ